MLGLPGRHRLRRWALVGMLPTSLLAMGCETKPEVASQRTFDPGPVPTELAAGETLFTQNCAQCHGNLAMGTERGPPLVHIIYQPNHHSDESFRRAASLGVAPHHWSFGPMPAVTAVTAEQVEEIIKYVRWLQRKAGIGD